MPSGRLKTTDYGIALDLVQGRAIVTAVRLVGTLWVAGTLTRSKLRMIE
jgi:hypothetical protein